MTSILKSARTRKGLTQAALGEAIGRDQSTVSKYEAGSARVDVDVAPRLAEVLGLSLVDVLYPSPGAVGLRRRAAAEEGVRAGASVGPSKDAEEQHGDRVTRAGVDVECADGEVAHPGQGGELVHAANDELFSGVGA